MRYVCYRYPFGVMFLHGGTSLGLKTFLFIPFLYLSKSNEQTTQLIELIEKN